MITEIISFLTLIAKLAAKSISIIYKKIPNILTRRVKVNVIRLFDSANISTYILEIYCLTKNEVHSIKGAGLSWNPERFLEKDNDFYLKYKFTLPSISLFNIYTENETSLGYLEMSELQQKIDYNSFCDLYENEFVITYDHKRKIVAKLNKKSS